MVRIVSPVSGILGLGFIGISIALFVQYAQLKKAAGTNATVATASRQVMLMGVALLVMGLILTALGFATAFKSDAVSDDEKGVHTDADDERNYSVDAFPDFEDRMLAQQLHNLDGRSAVIDKQKTLLRSRLNAARPAPIATAADHV